MRAPSLPLPAARLGCREGGAHIRAWTGRGVQTGENGRGREDRCGVAGAPPPFACGGATQTLRAGQPPFTLLPYPMRLNGAVHNPRVRGAPLPFSAPPPLCVSTTLCGVPHAQPLRAPPFGCCARAIPHAGWCVQGGIRKVGCAGVVHAGRCTGSCSYPLLGDVRTGGHAEAEGARTVWLPSPCKRSAMGGERVSACPSLRALPFAPAEGAGALRVRPHAPVRSAELPPLFQQGGEAARRATLGRVGEAARDPGDGGRGCTSPRATQEVGSLWRWRVRVSGQHATSTDRGREKV